METLEMKIARLQDEIWALETQANRKRKKVKELKKDLLAEKKAAKKKVSD